MRAVFFFVVALLVITICLTEGGKKEHNNKHRDDGRSKKSGHQQLDNFVDDEVRIKNYGGAGKDGNHVKLNHKQMPYDRESSKMKQHKKAKSAHKEGHKDHLTWLHINKESECGIQCKSGEVCITGPIDTKPLCVLKKDLKKSMKMFHRFQKKEMKAWKQFKKEHHSDGSFHADYNSISKKSKMDIEEMKKHQLEAQNVDHQKDMVKTKAEFQPFVHLESEVPEECSTSQFTQMRTRLMGWFHLLHGQDHLARKAHDGNIKHFYKHVSVKKELREHQGNKCECLKSAMWQFLQMDKDGDDYLNGEEMSVLKDNTLEPCMQPYLTSCDQDADGKFSSNEWCCCFSNVVAPCFKKVDETRRSGQPVTYMPRCDKEGYFMREQCSGESEKDFKCWCVDYNGNVHKGTDTNGRAHCNKMSIYGMEKPQRAV
ncbi:hypothetical protein BsWGS_05788 [Bradybaena similaris]